ncbi:tyrosine-type recombinase/integrase [Ideonella sp. DXS29W]|uniref:Tyrosine-type recombinase/integrase n=1 Tax=Ideonella lacteola TaxID=2984193 RepID=A0ABU9BW33_9BURK
MSHTYVRRLGPAHFSHLRAVVEGLPIEDSAARYLAADSRPAARAAHAEVVQLLRAVARRHCGSAWRLIGLTVTVPQSERPTFDQWIASKAIDVDDWGEQELIEQYEADCPADEQERRRVHRALGLREKQLQLLKDLEPVAAQTPAPSDLIEDWFDSLTAERLQRGGLLRLDELRRRIARGGRWYAYLPAIGATKASRIVNYLDLLLPDAQPSSPSSVQQYASAIARQSPGAGALQEQLSGRHGLNRCPRKPGGITADDDLAAIDAFIDAKAGTVDDKQHRPDTAKAYRTNCNRLLLWCIAERNKPLSSMNADDCAAFKQFLSNIPEHWIGRRRARYGATGWTPFAGQLSIVSQQHALSIVGALFRWLTDAGYLAANPWPLVNTRLGDDPRLSELDSRAFTPEAWEAVLSYVKRQAPSPAQARTEFAMEFVEAVGLRAAELVSAVLGQFTQRQPESWAMQVHGKGALNRVVSVPPQAVRALNRYLEARGLPPLGQAPAHIPLVASVDDPLSPVSYRALYDSLKAWFRRGVVASSLSPSLRDTALRATPHWLRHTCGTRSLERGVPLAAVQGQFGHAKPETTMRYAKVQLDQRQDAFGAAFS